MIKCHYVKVPKVGKVLISGCWGTVHSLDMADCYCADLNRKDRITILEEKINVLERKITCLEQSKIKN